MVDLSQLPNDGGGTQYTFLEAIYNNSAIILNRKWIENIERNTVTLKKTIIAMLFQMGKN